MIQRNRFPGAATHLIQDGLLEPLIQFVDSMILTAHQQSSSDIHIEPYEKNCRIRYRQHGILTEIIEIPIAFATRVVARLKVMAKLDIAEQRLPQDGRFQLQNIDIRINTCPTLFGEKVVLRLLNSMHQSMDIASLGFSTHQKELFLNTISQPQGMIIVTGPTGSGKTVTLYSALTHLNQPEKNISTVEDPVEIRLAGINQVNINPKIGLEFSTILRTFLRQDPDIIMVGEIRDKDTADIAIQAAQTGHLVLTTLHTNSAIETITRLQSMGIFSYNIANSISLIIAQRLIRELCSHCKKVDDVSSKIFQNTVYRANGCEHCVNGYTKRGAIYEFLPINSSMMKLIIDNARREELYYQAKQDGFATLKDAALQKVIDGVTSLAEINRVIQL